MAAGAAAVVAPAGASDGYAPDWSNGADHAAVRLARGNIAKMPQATPRQAAGPPGHEAAPRERHALVRTDSLRYFTWIVIVLLHSGPYERCAPSPNCRVSVWSPGGSVISVSDCPLPKCSDLSLAGITVPFGTGWPSISR